jgi:hypothetical protein
VPALSLPALEEILAATLAGMSVDTFEADVAKWLGTDAREAMRQGNLSGCSAAPQVHGR